jgi:hypothetical protein
MLAGILGVWDTSGSLNALLCPFVAPVVIRSNQPVGTSDSLLLKRRTSNLRAQRWEFEAALMPVFGYNPWLGLSIAAGHGGSIYVRPPQPMRPSGIAEATSSFSIPVGLQGGTYVAGGTLLNGQVGINLRIGDFITFEDAAGAGGYTKLHMVANYDGVGRIGIFPALTRTMSGTVTVYTGARACGRFFIDTSVQLGITYTDGILSDAGIITLVENLI